MKILIVVATFLATAFHDGILMATAFDVVGGPSYPIDVVAQNYTDVEGVVMQGFLSLPPLIKNSTSASSPKVPAVIILHDQSGPDAYEQQRATMMSNELGYVGFAADVYGVETVLPEDTGGWGGERQAFISQFTGNATLFALRIQAAIDFAKTVEGVDADRIALVGYCLGGTGIVHYLNIHGDKGAAAGAISIHPSLFGNIPGPKVGNIAVPSLFLTGGNDFLTGPQAMANLEDDMNNASATWETVRYAKIEHAFSNWFSRNYNARADSRSWQSMTTFLEAQFGQRDYESSLPAQVAITAVNYTDAADNEFLLHGYLSVPNTTADQQLLPVVIIIPDDSGNNQYEQLRATQIAQEFGYLGFVADVYGNERMENPPASPKALTSVYLSNETLFVSRVQSAVDYVKGLVFVDPSKIAVMGYGVGGTGALYYALTSSDDESVKAIASFHGGLERGLPNATATISFKPHILIESGGNDDAMSDIIQLEEALISTDSNYEISRYSDAQNAFTNPNDVKGRYNARADVRSMEAMESLLQEVFAYSSAGDEVTGSTEPPFVATPTMTSSASHLTSFSLFGPMLALMVTGVANHFLVGILWSLGFVESTSVLC